MKKIVPGLKKYWFLYVLFLPILAYYIIYRYYPMLLQVVLSFKNYRIRDGIWGSEWVGMGNLVTMVRHQDFGTIVFNTIRISVLRLVVGFAPPIILSILLYDIRLHRFKKVAQTVLYIPHFFSWVIVYAMVFAIFSSGGLINSVLNSMGMQPVNFLIGEKAFLPLLIGSGVWKELGWATIIYLAALTSINPELFEAAQIDGAGPLKRIWHITLPGITNVMIFLLILNIGNIFKNTGAEQILIFYSPATYSVGDVIDTWVYRQGVGRLQYSLAASVSFVQSFFGLALILAANKISKKVTGVSIW